MQASPHRLSLDRRQRRPSWELGERIVADATRLELALVSEDDDVQVIWKRPFNQTRPEKGIAEAVLTVAGKETVSIYVRTTVKCSHKLSCDFRFAAQLAPHLPWFPLDSDTLQISAETIATMRKELDQIRIQFENASRYASIAQRRLISDKMRQLSESMENLDQADERLVALRKLLASIESNVSLQTHLYVKWPDSRQTLFRAVVKSPGKVDE